MKRGRHESLCEFCHKTFQGDRVHHVKGVCLENPWKCGNCNAQFPSSHAVNGHKRTCKKRGSPEGQVHPGGRRKRRNAAPKSAAPSIKASQKAAAPHDPATRPKTSFLIFCWSKAKSRRAREKEREGALSSKNNASPTSGAYNRRGVCCGLSGNQFSQKTEIIADSEPTTPACQATKAMSTPAKARKVKNWTERDVVSFVEKEVCPVTAEFMQNKHVESMEVIWSPHQRT